MTNHPLLSPVCLNGIQSSTAVSCVIYSDDHGRYTSWKVFFVHCWNSGSFWIVLLWTLQAEIAAVADIISASLKTLTVAFDLPNLLSL